MDFWSNFPDFNYYPMAFKRLVLHQFFTDFKNFGCSEKLWSQFVHFWHLRSQPTPSAYQKPSIKKMNFSRFLNPIRFVSCAMMLVRDRYLPPPHLGGKSKINFPPWVSKYGGAKIIAPPGFREMGGQKLKIFQRLPVLLKKIRRLRRAIKKSVSFVGSL